MIKKNKWKLLVSSLVTVLPIAVGLILWDALPERMATHWGFDGTADGWSGKPFAVFFMPLLLLAVHWVCLLVTSLDPKNKGQTQKIVGLVFWICPMISLFASGMIYAAAMGTGVRVEATLPVILGVIFVVVGNYLPKCKQNYTIGIKVPWALENEENWNATHRFGGKVWVLGSLLLMLCVFLPVWVTYYAVTALMAVMVLLPVVYSYVYHRRHGTTATAMPVSQQRLRAWVLVILLLVAAVLLLIGNIKVQYGETSFTVSGTLYRSLTVDYDAIDSIEYRDQDTAGARTNGYGSMRLLTATNKWLLAHAEAPEAKNGAVVGLVGENPVVNY